MMVSNDGGVPLFAQTLAGNTSDAVHFREVLQTLQRNITDEEFYAVIDSAFYSAEAIKLNVLWISRVPERIKLVGEIKEEYVTLQSMQDYDENYKFAEVTTNYADVKQRWIVVYSKMANQRVRASVMRAVKKEREDYEKKIRKINKVAFACVEDAQKAVILLGKQLKYHILKVNEIVEHITYGQRGRPTKNSTSEASYSVSLEIHDNLEQIDKEIIHQSIFVLATNQLDSTALPSEKILAYYKNQSKVEGGFKFLKDPLCFASAVFLKNEKRIIALSMIMCLCLLIYSLAMRKLRQTLIRTDATVPNQKGQRVQNPTMRWVFQMFEGVIIARIDIGSGFQELILNLSDELKKILYMLGASCMKMYLIDPPKIIEC